MDFALRLALVSCMIFLNRFRGGGFYADKLWGHPRLYVAPAVAVVTGVVHGPVAGFVAGAVYFLWSLTPWGFLMCLNHWQPPGREMSKPEALALKIMRGNYELALWLLHFVALIPAMLFYSMWACFMPIFVVLAYVAGWRFRPLAPIELAELLVGLVWGVYLAWGIR